MAGVRHPVLFESLNIEVERQVYLRRVQLVYFVWQPVVVPVVAEYEWAFEAAFWVVKVFDSFSDFETGALQLLQLLLKSGFIPVTIKLLLNLFLL